MPEMVLRSLLFPALLAAGLLVPGWLLGRVLRVPAGLPGALLGSAALLTNLLLVLDALGLALTLATLAAGLATVCLALLLLWRSLRNSASAPASLSAETAGELRGGERWLLVPAALGGAAIAAKVLFDPLSGLDTRFRWNFLAEEMLRRGTLAFYPPVSADDFTHYSWCDGISPLVAGQYFWSYLSWGDSGAWATVPAVLLQAAALASAVFLLARQESRPLAGYGAVAVLATSAVFLSGVAMGQETGFTALALAAMFLFLARYRESGEDSWLLWGGIAVGVGGLAREYGLVFTGFGLLPLVGGRARGRHLALFIAAAAAVAAPWYLRNWVRTGHPLYSLPLGGLFPVNPVCADYFATVNAGLRPGIEGAAWGRLGWLLIALAGVPLVLGVIAGTASLRQRWPWLVAMGVMLLLWLWSLGHTSGGYAYALRVLTPAIAVGAALAGAGLARWVGRRGLPWLALALAVPAVDAAARSLFMPTHATVAWWREPLGWREYRARLAHRLADPGWAAIVEAAEQRSILATDPFYHARFVALGGTPIAIFSPAVRFLFAEQADLNDCLQRLRAAGVRFIVLPPASDDISEQHLRRYPFFRQLAAVPPVAGLRLGRVYDLFADAVAPRGKTESAGTGPSAPPPPNR